MKKIILILTLIFLLLVIGCTKLEMGSTTVNDEHSHTYSMNPEGNGRTTYNDGHTHIIINFTVQENDGHTHELIRE